jgi:hypothetical protein
MSSVRDHPSKGTLAYVYLPRSRYDSSDDEGSGSSSSLRAILLAVAIVLIVLIVYYLWSPRNLARKLANCDWVLYTRDRCGFCKKQLRLLGGDYENLVECADGKVVDAFTSDLPIECDKVTGYPFWYQIGSGRTRVGLQTKEDLEAMLSDEDDEN